MGLEPPVYESYLTRADLSDADRSRDVLAVARLRGADLSGVDLRMIDLSGATMPDGTVHE